MEIEGDNGIQPNSRPRILVCIPAYNEAKNIAYIINKAKKYATEVIVCDDGSNDNTTEVAKGAGASVINHPNNKGYGYAIRSLFKAAIEKNADVIVTIDSDGQHDADEIPKVLEPIIKEGYDIVIGSRFILNKDKERVPAYRILGITTITKLAQTSSYSNITDAQSGFRSYSRNALLKLNLSEEGMPISTEILLKAKEKNLLVKEVPITISYDVDKSSTHNFVYHGMGVLFSIVQFISLRHPLVFYGLPGIGLLIVSGVFINNSFDLFSTTRFISTNMILISVGTAVGGIVLLATGTILYTITALLKGSKPGVLFSIIQFISLRHPMPFYGLPGIIIVT